MPADEEAWLAKAAAFSEATTPTSRKKSEKAAAAKEREALMLARAEKSLSAQSSPQPSPSAEAAWLDKASQFSECSTPTSRRKSQEEADKSSREAAALARAEKLPEADEPLLSEHAWLQKASQFSEATSPTSTRRKKEQQLKHQHDQIAIERAEGQLAPKEELGPAPPPPPPTAAILNEDEWLNRASQFSNTTTRTQESKNAEQQAAKKQKEDREAAFAAKADQLSPKSRKRVQEAVDAEAVVAEVVKPSPVLCKGLLKEDEWLNRANQFSQSTSPTQQAKRNEAESAKKAAQDREHAMMLRAEKMCG